MQMNNAKALSLNMLVLRTCSLLRRRPETLTVVERELLISAAHAVDDRINTLWSDPIASSPFREARRLLVSAWVAESALGLSSGESEGLIVLLGALGSSARADLAVAQVYVNQQIAVERDTAKAELAAARAELTRLKGLDQSWPLADVLDRLAEGVEHLLDEHCCDAHGHEQWVEGAARARVYAKQLRNEEG